jgi:hypothetical protein
MPQAASDRKARTSGTNLGVFDRRRRVPSPKRAPLAELQRVLTLYGDHYPDFDIRHFHQLAWRQHHVRFCYAFVDLRRRRATKRILHAELWEGGESIAAIMSRTLQDRLVNDARIAGIATVAAANRYLREHFLPAFNAELGRAPADPVSAFVLGRGVALEHILCIEEERVVGRDNVVTTERVALQLAKQPGRRTCAGLRAGAAPPERPAFGLSTTGTNLGVVGITATPPAPGPAGDGGECAES